MNIVDAAMLVAIEVHGGDRNKHDGEMYTLHLARVFINVKNAGGTEVQQAIAWLHDSVEDTAMTIQELGGRLSKYYDGPVAEVTRGVHALTKVKGQSNEEYYHSLTLPGNEDARFVKLNGDIVDNFRRNHLIKDEATKLRMATKYSMGVDILS